MLVWSNVDTHLSAAVRELIASWNGLQVIRPLAYAPDLNRPRASGHTPAAALPTCR